MAWTDVSTGDKVEAAHINDIHQALNGTVGKAQPMAFTEVDESATYALDVRNKDATNSLIARFRNAANEVVLSVVKEALNTAKQIVSTVATGTAPFVVNSTTKVDNLHVARATLADTVAGDAIDGDAIADGAVDSEHIAAGAIDLAHMSANSVDSEHIVAGAIDLAHMSANSVDSDQYVDGSIDRAHLAADIVDGTKIADDSIDSEHYVDGSIDTAHLANDAVDDTKVGNRVPQFYRRQGGSSGGWLTPGTTTYTPTSVRMQAGAIKWEGDLATKGQVAVTFPVAFSAAPLIFLTVKQTYLSADAHAIAQVFDHSESGFSINWYVEEGFGTGDIIINWLAIGPE